MRKLRFAPIVLLGLLCVVVGSVALVLGSNIFRSSQSSLGAPPVSTSIGITEAVTSVPDSGLATISETQDDITFTVQPGYASLNRITLAFTVNGPSHSYLYWLGLYNALNIPGWHWPKLTSNGVELPSLDYGDSGSRYGGSDGWQTLPGGAGIQGEGVLNYDASFLNAISDTIPLHLVVPLEVDNNPNMPPIPVPTDVPGTTPPTHVPAPPTQIPPPSKLLIFTFDFNMPTDRRCRVAQVNKTVEASDVRMTLNYVSVTAPETRFDISFAGTSPTAYINGHGTWSAHASLRPGIKAKSIDVLSNCEISDCRFSYMDSSLLDGNTGEWTLTVDDMVSSEVMAISHPEISDLWTFHFTMPPVSLCMSVPAPVGTSTP